MRALRHLFIISLAVLKSVSFANAKQKVAAYLNPDASSTPFVYLDTYHSSLDGIMSVPQKGKDGKQWYWLQYNSTFTGYTASNNINNNQTLTKGSVIHQTPDKSSQAITIINGQEKTVEILDVQDLALIRLTKPLVLYLTESAALTAMADLEKYKGRLTAKDNNASELPHLKIEIINDRSPTNRDGTSSVYPQAAALSKSDLENQEISTVEDLIPFSFQGIFKRAPRKNMFSSPPHPFQLMDAGNKRRLAYIDTTSLALPYPINEYFDKEVIVYGSTTKKGREIIIKAQNLRLN